MSNTSSFIIRFTNQEKATLHKLAQLEGKTMTDYIKSKIFSTDTSNSSTEKIFNNILKITLANNAILNKTVAKDFSEQEKDSLKNEINDTTVKLLKQK